MAILKFIRISLLLIIIEFALTSCYQEFDPDLQSKSVLCMNSEITPDNPVTLFLTRSWCWTEDSEHKVDVDVTDAEVKLYVNGQFKELLILDEEETNSYDYSGPKVRKCYRGSYRVSVGDEILIEASSAEYGNAHAEAKIPEPVYIDKVEIRNLMISSIGDTSGFPACKDRSVFIFNLNALIHITDKYDSKDYYDVKVGLSPYSNYDHQAEAYGSLVFPGFDEEPLFTEHVSVLESGISDNYGYSIFSDRQINGKSYPLRITFSDCRFSYQNPQNLEAPKEYGIVVTLRHIDESYYKHVISVWNANDAIIGALGEVGLANPVYAYSNVSTNAGVVTAYADTKVTIPYVKLIELYMEAEGNSDFTLPGNY
ncbi:MAG: DUF4249 domain-containing protein [Muribaculaceae bacterium]|nr:DUF4249 domain-containing protein [Muribaculaceae bacterium]